MGGMKSGEGASGYAFGGWYSFGGRGGGGARLGFGASGAGMALPLSPFCFLVAGLESSSDESSDKSDESGSPVPFAALAFGLDLDDPLAAPLGLDFVLAEVIDETEARGLGRADGP